MPPKQRENSQNPQFSPTTSIPFQEKLWFSVRKKYLILWNTPVIHRPPMQYVHIFGRCVWFSKNRQIYTMYKHESYVCFSLFVYLMMFCLQHNYPEAHTFKKKHQATESWKSLRIWGCLQGMIFSGRTVWLGFVPTFTQPIVAAPKIRPWVT